MSNITLRGYPVHTVGVLPAIGSDCPDFKLTKKNLSETHLSDYRGKRIVLNIFVSLDTTTCASSVRHFNSKVQELDNAVVLCVSTDLPFAHKRFCVAEGLDKVIYGSVFRSPEFGRSFGLTITDGIFTGLLSRAVIIIDEDQKIIYTEQVPEISQEPDYERALSVL